MVNQLSDMTNFSQDRRRAYLIGGLIGVSAAFLFGGYELVRSPTNTLFKAAYGTAALPYAMAAVPPTLVVVLYVYGRLLSWIGPRRTLIATTLASCLLIAGAYGAIAKGWAFGAAILYVTREAYIVLLMEQYWSFLNSSLGEANARRLNGPICGIGSAGSIVGAMLVESLAKPMGPEPLLLIAAAITLPTVVFVYLAYRVGGQPKPAPSEPRTDSLGAAALLRQPVLGILLAVVLLTQAGGGTD